MRIGLTMQNTFQLFQDVSDDEIPLRGFFLTIWEGELLLFVDGF